MTPTQPHAALRDYLLASPAADRIALARELLAGTGRVDVPREPTVQMCRAAAQLDFGAQHDPTWPEYYRAMLAASDNTP